MLDIIIACYNKPEFLQTLLLSIQNFCKIEIEKNLVQIYICDDCSKYSEEYLELIKDLPYCHYYKNPQNLGPGEARNLGLQYGSGEWIAFIDDDDYLIDNPFKNLRTKGHQPDIFLRNAGYLDSLHGCIINRNFLAKYNLVFDSRLNYGTEDSIFRILMILCADSIKVRDVEFYFSNLRVDSNFSYVSSFSIGNQEKMNFGIIELFCYYTNLLTSIERLVNQYPDIKKKESWNQIIPKILQEFFLKITDDLEPSIDVTFYFFKKLYSVLLTNYILVFFNGHMRKYVTNQEFLAYIMLVLQRYSKQGDVLIYTPQINDALYDIPGAQIYLLHGSQPIVYNIRDILHFAAGLYPISTAKQSLPEAIKRANNIDFS